MEELLDPMRGGDRISAGPSDIRDFSFRVSDQSFANLSLEYRDEVLLSRAANCS